VAAKIREVDVSDVGVVPLAKTGTSVAERLWVIVLASGPRGGYQLVVDGIHLNDLLQDSGVQEPGDAAYVGETDRDWTPTALAGRWTELEADQVSVFDGTPDRPGAVLEVFREASGATWRFRMTDRLWATLVREVAREIGFPWFNAALASGAVDTEP